MDIRLLRYIPKKIRPHVEDVFRDSDGIWVWGDEHFIDTLTEYHTIHTDTIAELREHLREVKITNP